MRECSVCKELKPLSGFYKNRADCIDCHKLRDASRKDRSGVRRNDTPAAKERKRRWAAKNKDPIKDAARRKVRHAISTGALTRKSECEQCGSGPKRSDGVAAVQAHHDDYSKPLCVRWLCAKCHTAWHKKHDAARARLGEKA